MHFTKLHGIGNDYIYVDCFQEHVDDPPALARRIADRHFGVGADGLILIMPPSDGVAADVRMRMFNADGSESEMCGNGIRCVCKYAYDHGLSRSGPMRIETGAGVLELTYRTDDDDRVEQVTVNMGVPVVESSRVPVRLRGVDRDAAVIDHPFDAELPVEPAGWIARCGLAARVTCVSMGNPHAVLYCRDVAAVPLDAVGPPLERRPCFPNRANIHFVQVHGEDEVTMRTWERGSGATLACGTGATAVCAAGVLSGRTGGSLLAHLPGGDLHMQWAGPGHPVMTTGPAVEVFSGEWLEQPARV